MSNGIDIAIENLKTELRNLKLKISECRKAGLDTKIVELKIMNIPFKIQLAEATKSYKDIEKINTSLEDVKKEIGEIENSNIDNDEHLNQISLIMEKLNKSISENKIQEAKSYYLKCVGIYNKLENKDKKQVFVRLSELRGRLKQ